MTSHFTDPLQMWREARALRDQMAAVRALITPPVAERMAALVAREPGLTPLQLVTEALDPDGPPSPLLDSTEAATYALSVATSLDTTGSLVAALERQYKREASR